MGGRAFRAFAGLTALVYAVLVFWAGPQLRAMIPGAGTLDFDGALLSFEALRAALAGMDPGAPGFYARVVRPLDTVFPVLLSLTLVWAGGRWGGARASWIVALALVYLVSDLGENAAIAAIFEAGAEGLTPALQETARRLTILKFAALGLGLVLLGGAVLRRQRETTR